ncbi:tryptophan dimethylallyltransferase family protein [Streptomyces sp. NPDC048172]|uniref:tryptophan dimethylallyltransferase family protein n=1 Tax=Streptomyces sp. NPDC048172 TaxID=3365505 RepID=UPI0037101DA1
MTFSDYGIATATRLFDSAGMDVAGGTATLRRMLSPWGARRIGERPDWHSDVCADGSPIEFSAAFADDRVQIRALVESLPEVPSTPAAQRSAAGLTQGLIQEFGADGGRLAAVWDLFLPHEDPAGFAMMHAAVFAPTGRPEFKVYLNPEANGTLSGVDRTRAALERVGLADAWAAVSAYAGRGFDLDRIVYFGLDLVEGSEARVKVYFRHYEAVPEELDARMEVAAQHESGLLGDFCRELTGKEGELREQPLVSNLTFTASGGTAPVSATVYVPLWLYADSDRTIERRVSAVMRDLGLPAEQYRTLLDHVARRPLADGRGIHTYASLRVGSARPRVATYWSTELYDRYPSARYQRG